MISKVGRLPVCLLLLALAACGDAGSPEDVKVGNRAPSFSLKSLDGATVKSSSFEGRPVVLNFWATYCAPCLSEIPELKQVAADAGVRVVGISLDQDGEGVVKSFVREHGINYPVLMGDEEVFQRFNGVGIPYTLLLDSSQRIVKIYRGPTTKAQLEQDLKGVARASL